MSISKYLTRSLLLLVFSFSFLFANNVEINFDTSSLGLKPKEVKEVNIFLKNSSNFYGVELSLKFDPQSIKVVDTKGLTQLTKLATSQFFNKKKNLVIQNSVDNNTGTISYVVTLLNPEKPISKNGKLLSFHLQGVKEGTSFIKFKIAKLGTKKGEVVLTSTQDLKVEIATTANMLLNNWYLIGLIILVFLIGFILFKKKK